MYISTVLLTAFAMTISKALPMSMIARVPFGNFKNPEKQNIVSFEHKPVTGHISVSVVPVIKQQTVVAKVSSAAGVHSHCYISDICICTVSCQQFILALLL